MSKEELVAKALAPMLNARYAKCAEPDCSEPPGTPWTPYWCLKHDQERRARIRKNLVSMIDAGKES